MNNFLNMQKNGYVFLRGVIPIRLIESSLSYAAELLNCSIDPKSIISAMTELEQVDKDNFYVYCKKMGEIISSIQIALTPDILELVKQTLNTQNIYLTDSALFFNKADVQRLQYDWHSEKSYFPDATEVITLWYPWLHNVNATNGTMVLAEGSHHEQHTAERIEVHNGLTQMKIKSDSLVNFKIINCDLNIGDAVLFKLNLVHKTGQNTSGIPRSTIITRYTTHQGKYKNGWKTQSH